MEPFDSLNLTWQYLINGAIGGLVWSMFVRDTWRRCVVRIVIGSLSAGYITHALFYVAPKARTEEADLGTFASFAIGLAGLSVIPAIRAAVVRYTKRRLR